MDSFVYGIDTGIIASTIAQQTFKSYMYGESMKNVSIQAGLIAAVCSTAPTMLTQEPKRSVHRREILSMLYAEPALPNAEPA